MNRTLNKQISKINAITAFLIFASIVFIYIAPIMPRAHASSPLGGLTEGLINGAGAALSGEGLGGVIEAAKGGFATHEDNTNQKAMVEDIYRNVMVQFKNMLDGKGTLGSVYQNVSNLEQFGLGGAYAILKTAGATLAVGIALAHMLEKIQREQDTMEAITRGLLELFICFMFIMNIDKVTEAIADAATQIIGKFMPSGEEISVNAEEVLEKLTGDTTGGALWRMEADIMLLVPSLLAKLLQAALFFALFQILVEIILRKLFMPLAIADIFHEGLRSPGMRFIKRYFGAYLKIAASAGAAMIVTSVITAGDTAGILPGADSNIVTALMEQVAIMMTGTGLVFKAGELTNDIVGA